MFPDNAEEYMVILTFGAITTVSLPFWRYNVARVGARATIVKMATGKLAVFSPVPLKGPVQKMLQDLGNDVRYIVAPDIEHHMALSEWAKAYPQARVIGPSGLAEKREKQGNDPVKFSFTFSPDPALKNQKIDDGSTAPGSFDAEFEYEYVHAHTNREIVFHHKPAKTMIQADLMFNLPPTEQFSIWDKTTSKLSRWFGSVGDSASSSNAVQRSFVWYVLSASDRKSFNESVRRINKWDFETIIPCHGDIITDGKNRFQSVMAAHLDPSTDQDGTAGK